MKERLMIFGVGFLFSCLAIMFFLHFRRVRSGEESMIRRWVNAAGQIGPIVEWIEGDTLIVRLPSETATVRLNAVDTPALHQPGGRDALEFAQKITGTAPVRVLEFRRNEQGDIVGEVYNKDNESVNEELMKAGLAWYFEPDSPNNPYYRELNDKAIQTRIGLWSKANPSPPWDQE